MLETAAGVKHSSLFGISVKKSLITLTPVVNAKKTFFLCCDDEA